MPTKQELDAYAAKYAVPHITALDAAGCRALMGEKPLELKRYPESEEYAANPQEPV